MFHLFQTVVAQFLIVLVSGQCRTNWIPFKDSCYFFSDVSTDWSAADFDCTILFGGYLAEIESAAENQFLRTEAKRHHAANPNVNANGYFVGGSDIEVEGQFRWMHSGHPLNYTDWLPLQPDSTLRHEDCLHLYALFDFHWNDISCSSKAYFICEKPATPGSDD